MSRKKTVINPERGKRLKTLIDREKMTQKGFGERIHMSQQNISLIIKGKNPLTEETAKSVVKEFPEYRIEWLLGYDNSMTQYDWAEDIQSRKDIVADSMWAIIEKSLNKERKSLIFHHRQGEHVDSSQRFHADCYYTINDKSGNEIKRLSAMEVAKIEQKIQEYCDFLVYKYL